MHRRLRTGCSGLLAALLPGLALFAAAAPGHAWNDFGHEVVARIAWLELEPELRQRALALLRQAPEDSRMHCLDLGHGRRQGCGRFAYRLDDARSAEDGDRILFERAAYWADLARGLDKYNRPTWHYIGWTWQEDADGTAQDTGLPVPEPNAVSQLKELALSVADRATPSLGQAPSRQRGPGDQGGPDDQGDRGDQRAIHLAWIFHLVGDIHQPLHAASRVTARHNEREGDRGGNGFRLDDWNRNLHAFWDGALDGPVMAEQRLRLAAELARDEGVPPEQLGHAPTSDEERLRAALFQVRDRAFEAWKDRVAAEARSRHPKGGAIRAGLEPGDFEAWARESNRIVRSSVYPDDLERGEAPADGYADLAYAISLERAALAGYRLADLLRSMLGDGSR